MSTVVAYLMALFLQFMGTNIPHEHNVTKVYQELCEKETTLPTSFGKGVGERDKHKIVPRKRNRKNQSGITSTRTNPSFLPSRKLELKEQIIIYK